jgi:DNA-binding HxlR family transcriptional regulator
LTSLGNEVAAQVEGLADWIEENLPRIMKVRRSKHRTGK